MRSTFSLHKVQVRYLNPKFQKHGTSSCLNTEFKKKVKSWPYWFFLLSNFSSYSICNIGNSRSYKPLTIKVFFTFTLFFTSVCCPGKDYSVSKKTLCCNPFENIECHAEQKSVGLFSLCLVDTKNPPLVCVCLFSMCVLVCEAVLFQRFLTLL